MQAIGNPFPIFLGLDGKALELGYIYIGVENLDPETHPQTTYFNEGGTSTATQPIRTIAGYPDSSGSPAQIYTVGKHSIRVRNAAGEQVFYAPSAGVSEAVGAGDPYFIHTQFLGDAPGVSQIVCKHVFAADVSFPADMAASVGFDFGTFPSGSSSDFDMQYDGVSFGTMTVDTTGDTTIDCTALDAEQFHVFTLVSPDSATAAADIGGVFIGAVS